MKLTAELLAGAPGGVWVVLETTTVDNTKLYATGYRYSCRKINYYLVTEGCGSTEPGVPYETKFVDGNGNVCIRHVARPACVGRFHAVADTVGVLDRSAPARACP